VLFHNFDRFPSEYKKQTEELAARQPALNLFARKDMPPFNSFFPDDAGRLFVMSYEQGQSKEEYIHDIFSAEGVFIGRIGVGRYGILGRALNLLGATATNGRFYRLYFKENGYPELVVYRMV
jgi:hypothetical protein